MQCPEIISSSNLNVKSVELFLKQNPYFEVFIMISWAKCILQERATKLWIYVSLFTFKLRMRYCLRYGCTCIIDEWIYWPCECFTQWAVIPVYSLFIYFWLQLIFRLKRSLERHKQDWSCWNCPGEHWPRSWWKVIGCTKFIKHSLFIQFCLHTQLNWVIVSTSISPKWLTFHHQLMPQYTWKWTFGMSRKCCNL